MSNKLSAYFERQREVIPSPLLVSLRAAAKMLSVSERTVWAMTNDGRLPSIRAGRRRLISVSALESWIAHQQSAGAGKGGAI
jgi:excisionase family DNA binding protein